MYYWATCGGRPSFLVFKRGGPLLPVPVPAGLSYLEVFCTKLITSHVFSAAHLSMSYVLQGGISRLASTCIGLLLNHEETRMRTEQP